MRWRQAGARDGVRVYCGVKHVGSSRAAISGGAVKLQDLSRVYPNHSRNPNILYLISSALPEYGDLMGRIAVGSGARLVINQNGVAYPAWHGPGYEITNRPLMKLLHLADYVFYQSMFCKISADRFLGEPQGGWEILYNPVDTNIFSPMWQGIPGTNDRPPLLLLAGTHSHAYRVRCAIQTIAELIHRGVDVRLRVAGRYAWGYDETSARRDAERFACDYSMSDRVEFLGAYTQDEAPGLMRTADILLHTKYNDPCPRLVVEAMACGLPVVYSASGGMPELVGSDAGEGVAAPLDWERDHPPAPEMLADAVIKVLGDLNGYRHRARTRAVERFDVKPWLERHHRVFKTLLLRRRMTG
jgi:glycosyltransferase involved in cell wall biosynthesis